MTGQRNAAEAREGLETVASPPLVDGSQPRELSISWNVVAAAPFLSRGRLAGVVAIELSCAVTPFVSRLVVRS